MTTSASAPQQPGGTAESSVHFAWSMRRQILVLCLILLIGAAVRLRPTMAPSLDRSMWKEIDYLVISNNYAAHGMHFFEPEINWPAEAPRVTAMECPLVPYAAAVLYKIFGFSVVTVRAIPFLAFLLLPVYLFLLVRDEMDPLTALLAAFIAVLMPVHHYFGRILFSEPVSIAMSVAALFHLNRWAKSRIPWHALCAWLAFTIAVAVKFEPLFLLLPMSYAWWRARGFGKALLPFGFFVAASLVIPAAWMLYAYHLSQTSIDVFGVVPFLHGHNKLQTLTMVRQFRHFWLVLGHRLWLLDWGAPGSLLTAAGLYFAVKKPAARFFLVYLASVCCYFLIVAEGNIDAAYRQLNAVPVFSVFLAMGLLAVLGFLVRNSGAKLLAAAALAVLLIFAPSYWTLLHESPAEPAHPHAWALAQAVKAHSQPGEPLIALGEYTAHVGGNDLSPVLYYYAGRQGWTLNEDQLSNERIQQLIAKKAVLFAVEDEFALEDGYANPKTAEFVNQLKRVYPVLYQSGNALLLDLKTGDKTLK